MPQTQVFGQTVSWSWKHKVGHANQFHDGMPQVQTMPLNSLRDGDSVRLHSKDVDLRVTIEFEDVASITKVGFANTIYSQYRRWYYVSGASGLQGTTLTETIQPLPMWDDVNGEAAPWYGCTPDDELWAETDVWFNDAPNLPPYQNVAANPNFPYGHLRIPRPGGVLATEHLFYIEGIEQYEAILAIESDGHIEALDSMPWYVIWNSAVIDGRCVPAGNAGTYLNQGRGNRQLVMAGAGSSNSKQDTAGIWRAATLPPHIAQAAQALRRRHFFWVNDANRRR